MLMISLGILLLAGLLAAGLAIHRFSRISRIPVEHPKLAEIASYIAQGARAFLRREYQVLFPVILIGAFFLWISFRSPTNEGLQFIAITFILGAGSSALAGYLGMRSATLANSRTSQAALGGVLPALKMSFGGGSITGLSVLGLGLIGLALVTGIPLFIKGWDLKVLTELVLPLLAGYSLGASAFALFARVAGGIFTKAADVGADLVGKLEAGIPEDDHRNPAVIADNVGDNVGDLAGMAADLYSSFVGSLVGAMFLASGLAWGGVPGDVQIQTITLPLVLAALGVVTSLIGMAFVRTKAGKGIQRVLNLGSFTAAGATALLGLLVVGAWVGFENQGPLSPWGIYFGLVFGLAGALAIGLSTEYYTAVGRSPVNSIVKSAATGPATTLISGLGVGMMSSLPTIGILTAVVLASFQTGGILGVALAALGMILIMGIQLSISAYGPIADNAGGLAEMAEMPREVREVTDRLDAVGNTTSAMGKGFAIGSAALTSLILFVSFKESAHVTQNLDILHMPVLAGLLLGAMIPLVFASFNMLSIGKAALAMIEEVRRQFREKPGILDETEKPDYNACISIATSAALLEMVAPGLLAVFTPIIVGFLGGVPMLLGLLLGVTVSAVVLAIFMSNAGGAWDNAKKSIEGSGGKGTEAHKASVVGDTVGDPFKDTAGPSLNILIKIMAMVSLVIAPLLKTYWGL